MLMLDKIKHEKESTIVVKNIKHEYNMKRIQSKLHRTGTYDVSKISLF